LKKNIFNFLIFNFLLFFTFSCQETDEQDSSDNSPTDTSTLDENLNGASAELNNLFFNFNSELDYSYNYYTVAGLGYGNTIENPCLIRSTDKLNLYTFPEYLVEARNCDDPSIICTDSNLDYDNFVQNYLIDETYGEYNGQNYECSCYCVDDDGDEVSCGSNNAVGREYNNPEVIGGACQNKEIDNQTTCENLGWIWFDEFIDCSLMDVNEDCEMEVAQDQDILNVQNVEFSVLYNNLESLTWDADAGRYKPQPSPEQEISVAIIDSSDVYDISNYWTIIDEWQDVSGMVYVDHSQWNDTTLIIPEDPPEGSDSPDIIIDTTFIYTKTILGLDSLMFRINADCNNDGIWTQAEDFEDTGLDGCFDDNETGYVENEEGLQDNQLSYTCGECQINGVNDADGDGVCDPDPNGDNWQEGFDLLVYTEGNSIYDAGEEFTDRPDNLLVAEIYYDIDGNGTRNGLEPFADLNCNGAYDSEIGVNDGNGIWDGNERFIDFNLNGIWDNSEYLYSTSQSPNQIIINHDTNFDGIVDDTDGEPVILSDIEFGGDNDAMVYLNADYVSFSDIIAEQEEQSYQYYKYTPIKEIVTVFSNEIVEDIPSNLTNQDYFVTKTLWDMSNTGVDVDGDGIPDRDYDYDYHLFRYSDLDDNIGAGHLLKLVHPKYYYHYGYFETPSEIEEGFYETSDLMEDIMIYTVNGQIRDGERVTSYEEMSVDSDNDGINDMNYEVSKIFEVETEMMSAPLRKVLGNVVSEDDPSNLCSEGDMIVCAADGRVSCADGEDTEYGYNDCGTRIDEISDCSSDTTFSTFKVIRTKEITLIGNGVEFGERNTIWMADGKGIIKDKLEHRWTEANGVPDWKEFSRLELESLMSDNNTLNRLFNSHKILDIKDFKNEHNLNNDPFIPNPTAIIQRSRSPYDQ
tara:strand:+ start:1941 stop:4679 length:2739 start_codon:yes stop_codon:yes gene_type:complete